MYRFAVGEKMVAGVVVEGIAHDWRITAATTNHKHLKMRGCTIRIPKNWKESATAR